MKQYEARHVFAKLINTENHSEILRLIPSEQVLDLSLVFYMFEDNDPDEEEILVTYEMMDRWGIGLEQLSSDAKKNTRNILGEMIRPLKDLIEEMIRKVKEDCSFEEAGEDYLPMYVLSNHWKRNGAVCVLYGSAVRELADMLGSDLFVIPSSIHEVILVPANGAISREELDQLIMEVNRSELTPEDVLSDHAYFYSREKGYMGM